MTAVHERADILVIGGGQSGLAAADAARSAGLTPIVLEAGSEPVGSWPHYYDSLTLFSPAGYSGTPDNPFPGDPDRYPTRDEVTAYLRAYAESLDVDIRTRVRVSEVESDDSGGFVAHTTSGRSYQARGLIAATGSFGNPVLPSLPGADDFTGRLLHAADYRSPEPYTGQRVVVVGAGNSAIQIGDELADVADVTVASRNPLVFVPQVQHGYDLHYWLNRTGFDDLPPAWLARLVSCTLVLDTGDYATALANGRLDRRPMFDALDGNAVVWSDGTRESVDTVLLATGYRPDLGYLRALGALSENGMPRHDGGLSGTHPGLGYVGLEFQRSFASNTLRGARRDAEHVVRAVTAHVLDAAQLIRH